MTFDLVNKCITSLAVPMTYGSSWARDQTPATAVTQAVQSQCQISQGNTKKYVT